MHYRVAMLQDGLYGYEIYNRDPRRSPEARLQGRANSRLGVLAAKSAIGTTIEWVGDVQVPPEFHYLRHDALRLLSATRCDRPGS